MRLASLRDQGILDKKIYFDLAKYGATQHLPRPPEGATTLEDRAAWFEGFQSSIPEPVGRPFTSPPFTSPNAYVASPESTLRTNEEDVKTAKNAIKAWMRLDISKLRIPAANLQQFIDHVGVFNMKNGNDAHQKIIRAFLLEVYKASKDSRIQTDAHLLAFFAQEYVTRNQSASFHDSDHSTKTGTKANIVLTHLQLFANGQRYQFKEFVLQNFRIAYSLEKPAGGTKGRTGNKKGVGEKRKAPNAEEGDVEEEQYSNHSGDMDEDILGKSKIPRMDRIESDGEKTFRDEQLALLNSKKMKWIPWRDTSTRNIFANTKYIQALCLSYGSVIDAKKPQPVFTFRQLLFFDQLIHFHITKVEMSIEDAGTRVSDSFKAALWDNNHPEQPFSTIKVTGYVLE